MSIRYQVRGRHYDYGYHAFVVYRGCTTTKSVKFTMLSVQTMNFTSRAVSDKVAFSP